MKARNSINYCQDSLPPVAIILRSALMILALLLRYFELQHKLTDLLVKCEIYKFNIIPEHKK